MEEVKDLESVNPSPTGSVPSDPTVTRVIGRASVVLLSSHFERYFYSINEEVVTYLNLQSIPSEQYPEEVRILHAKSTLDEIGATAWENRAQKLYEYSSNEAWLWSPGQTGQLDHNRFLAWMKAPKPKKIVRYYKYWQIKNIFEAVTRKASHKNDLFFSLQSLVELRNNIAHGDPAAQATQRDVKKYLKSVETFCERADRKLSSQIKKLFYCDKPW